MRHQLGWADLAGARVGIFGAGLEGRTAVRRLAGVTDDLVLVDDRPAGPVGDHEVVGTEDGGAALLSGCDVVIKSPGISAYRSEVVALEAAGVAVVGGIGLSVHEADRSRVVCITGTKGKSTTSSVLGHLAEAAGLRVEVTGNIGRPPFDPDVAGDLDLLVIETSSFQALDVSDAPGIVVVTSLDADHLDWHGSVERYQADKLSLTSLPGAGTTLVPAGDPVLHRRAELLGGTVRWVDDPEHPWADALGMPGRHNAANAELAAAVLRSLGVPMGQDPDALRAAAQGYAGLPGRFHVIDRRDGVEFIDDGLATNVLPTLAALRSLEGRRLAILVGGHDRGIDYGELISALGHREAATLVLGLPESGVRLVEAIDEMGTATEATAVATIDEAVGLADRWVGADGVVLLSPAAPSFSQFANWKERSEAFGEAVRQHTSSS
jgi:UDP-N-acetylmuramoylalanine--D-glutamate ligase